jgi:hypothetical protein
MASRGFAQLKPLPSYPMSRTLDWACITPLKPLQQRSIENRADNFMAACIWMDDIKK